MPLPKSFTDQGFLTPDQARRQGRKLKGLMIGTQGGANTGKTEFILTCPGPGIVLCIDRGFDAIFDNPNPPPTRRDDFAFSVTKAPAPTQHSDGPAGMAKYKTYWQDFYNDYTKALSNGDARTIGIDGDSDTWEMQRLASHGKLSGVFPQTRYADPKAARRVMYHRAWDSGKIIVATNKMKDEWIKVKDADGNAVMDDRGEEKREPSGRKERQGYPDYDYLFQVQLEHLYRPPSVSAKGRLTPQGWGIRILRSKANMDCQGQELWDEDCCFSSLVQLVYPNIPPSDWGL